MIVGVDIDGVISIAPLGLNFVPRILKRFWNRFMDLGFGRFVYLEMRKPNKEVRESLREMKRQGYTIVIISYMFKRHRRVVERWLRENDIPFDKLMLAQEGEKALGFKRRVVEEENCDIFFDDEQSIVHGIGEIGVLYLGEGSLLLPPSKI